MYEDIYSDAYLLINMAICPIKKCMNIIISMALEFTKKFNIKNNNKIYYNVVYCIDLNPMHF